MGIPRGVRDMSPDRFAFLLDVLNSSSGGNRQVTSFPRATTPAGSWRRSSSSAPRSTWCPSTDRTICWSGYPCADMPVLLLALQQQTPFVEHYWCDHTMSVPIENGRRLMLDVQGPADGDFLDTHYFARQHLLHLPTDPARHDAFIPSNTSKYGGATRRLGEILNTELASARGLHLPRAPVQSLDGRGVRPGRPRPDPLLDDAARGRVRVAVRARPRDVERGHPAHRPGCDRHRPVQRDLDRQKEQFDPSDLSRWDIVQLWGLDASRTSALGWLPAGQPRRTFLAGGSDAHGDFNYRRTGEFLGTKGANDDALGKPRNMVYVGEPQGTSVTGSAGTARPLSQQQVVAGLRSGDFAVTNGPAVRIAYDVNGNGVIDDADVPMGGVANFHSLRSFRVVVEWKSSPEFAPVEWIDLYMGVFAAGHADGMVYSPWRVPAGSNVQQSDIGGSRTYTDPNTHLSYTQTPSFPYWYDPTGGTLAITPYAGEEYEGRRVVTIDLARFPVGDGVCVRKVVAPATKTAANPRTAAAMLLASTTAGATDGTTKPPATTTVVERQISLDVRLQQLIDGTVSFPPPIPCDAMEFQNAVHPDKLFVRAEVRNGLVPGSNMNCQDAPIGDQVPCVHRHAFTNPVWVDVLPCVGPACEVVTGGSGTLTSFQAPSTPTAPVKDGAVATLGTTTLTR